jgi:hypothetical protein
VLKIIFSCAYIAQRYVHGVEQMLGQSDAFSGIIGWLGKI